MRFELRVITWTFLVLLAALGNARADPPLGRPTSPVALDHLARGSQLYKVRSFEEAATEFRAGAVVESAPIFDYNLGQCYRQLGRYKDAIWHYEAVLKVIPPNGERATAVREFIDQMKAELDRKAMTQPPLEPAQAPAPGPKPAAQHSPPPPVPEVTRAMEPWYADPFGWGLAGSGLVGAGVSLGLFVSASGLEDEANHAPSQSEASRLHDRADRRSLLATVIGIGGGGLLVTGILKLVIHPGAPERAVTSRWLLRVGPTSVGFAVRF